MDASQFAELEAKVKSLESENAALKQAGCRTLLVSGGLRPALLPLAERLGIGAADVHGVEIAFDADGRFVALDVTNRQANEFMAGYDEQFRAEFGDDPKGWQTQLGSSRSTRRSSR